MCDSKEKPADLQATCNKENEQASESQVTSLKIACGAGGDQVVSMGIPKKADIIKDGAGDATSLPVQASVAPLVENHSQSSVMEKTSTDDSSAINEGATGNAKLAAGDQAAADPTESESATTGANIKVQGAAAGPQAGPSAAPSPSMEQKADELRKLSLKALKEKCHQMGVLASGSKEKLIQYIMNPLQNMANRKRKTYTIEDVHTILRYVGIQNPERVNPCLKEGIRRKIYTIDSLEDLDKPDVLYGDCPLCEEPASATIREVLYQDHYLGPRKYRPVSGCPNDQCTCSPTKSGPIFECENQECKCALYVIGMCHNHGPYFDTGKYLNHCTKCTPFGQCIGGYPDVHCDTCGKHYEVGSMRQFKCHTCVPDDWMRVCEPGWNGTAEPDDDPDLYDMN